MNPLVEKLLEEGATALAAGAIGWVVSTVKVGRRFTKFREKIDAAEKTRDEFSLARADEYEAKLAARFEALRGYLLQGLRLEVQPLKERVDEVAKQLDSLRNRSGEWSSEAELAKFVVETQRELTKLNRELGTLEGRLRRSISDRPER